MGEGWGRERTPRWRAPGEIGKNFVALRNILKKKWLTESKILAYKIKGPGCEKSLPPPSSEQCFEFCQAQMPTLSIK